MEIVGLLESAIGLVLIYLVLSLICSAWLEAIVSWTGLRGENLRELIEVLCAGDAKVAHMLMAHPQLRALYAPADPEVTGNGILYWIKRALALCFDRGPSHKKSGYRPPSYIPPERFARALADMALGESVERLREAPGLIEQRLSQSRIEQRLAEYKKQIQGEAQQNEIAIRGDHCDPDETRLVKCASHLSKVLTRLWHQCGGDADAFLKAIEDWFEDGNDRATGWFKRKLSPKLFAVGALIAFTLNVDTLDILSRLSDDPEMRQAVVQMAVEQVKQGAEPDAGDPGQKENEFERARQQLLTLEPLLGWRLSSLPTQLHPLFEDASASSQKDPTPSQQGFELAVQDWLAVALWLLMKLAGLLITAIALSLGAPFWFDVLRKLVKVRASVSQADSEQLDAAGRQNNQAGAGVVSAGGAAPTSQQSAAGDVVRLTTGLVGLAPDAGAPDRTNARWMAELSNAAYASKPEATERLGALGLNLDLWMDTRSGGSNATFGDTDTQGFVAVSRDLIVVAFRGTEPTDAGDVLTDLKARMEPAGDWFPADQPPRVHRGFQAALEAVWSELEQHLIALAKDVPGRRLWFAGHSLGGALAVLAAARYSALRERHNRDREDRITKLMSKAEAGDADASDELANLLESEPGPLPPCGEIHTIGQPAVGDERFAAWLEARFGERLVRTINNRDVVPRLPTPALGYAHAGAELYFDSFGRMKINPGAWYRGLDALVLDPNRVRKQAMEAAGDHAATAYLELLKGPTSIQA